MKPAIIRADIPTEPATKGIKEVVELAPDPSIDAPSQLLESYEEEESHPYAVKYFNLYIPYYGVDDSPVRENLDAIDEFVKDEMETSNKKPNIDSYKKILDDLQKKLEIESNTEEESVIERLAGFIKAYNRIKKLEDKKNRKEIVKRIVKFAKGRDYDTDALALYLEEEYLKWLSTNQ